jgi:hypothetical protein
MSYDIHTDVKYAPLEVVDAGMLLLDLEGRTVAASVVPTGD